MNKLKKFTKECNQAATLLFMLVAAFLLIVVSTVETCIKRLGRKR